MRLRGNVIGCVKCVNSTQGSREGSEISGNLDVTDVPVTLLSIGLIPISSTEIIPSRLVAVILQDVGKINIRFVRKPF